MIKLCLPFAIAAGDNKIKAHRENNHEVYDYFNGRIRILTYHNRGAFLNLGQKKPAIVLALSIVFTAIISILFVFSFTCKGKGLLKTGLGLLLGGAFSNTYDRYKKGYVVDYLNFPKAPGFIRRVIFNLSDFAIIIGSLISVCNNN